MKKLTPPTNSPYRLVRVQGTTSLGRLRNLLDEVGEARTPKEREKLKDAVAVCNALCNQALKPV